MREIPCENCISFAICKAKLKMGLTDWDKYFLHRECVLVKEYNGYGNENVTSNDYVENIYKFYDRFNSL